MAPPLAYEATPWTQSRSGRQYRTLTIEGKHYTQWDHEKGPCAPLANATPRTTDPRNQTDVPIPSGHQTRDTSRQFAGCPQQDPAYHRSLFGSTTQGSTAHGPPVSHGVESSRSSYPSQGPELRPNNETSYTYSRQDDLRYIPYSTPATHGRGHQSNMIDGIDAGSGKRDHQDRVTGPQSTALERSNTYPSGTVKVVRKGGCTYYLDQNDQVIGPGTPRRDSEPPRRAPSLKAVTDGVNQLELETPNVKSQEPPVDQSDFPSKDNHNHSPTKAKEKGIPITPKSYLDPLPEDKKLNTTLIKAGTFQDDLLDKRYVLRTGTQMEKFFHPGRVLAMLWHESAGSTGTALSDGRRQDFTKGKYQVDIYTTIRRMVILRTFGSYSWCIPINTYSGQGLTKNGLSATEIEKHTIIYMTGANHHALPQELQRGLVKEPIAVKPASHDQKLKAMSRLNFGKVYTVEHNIRAMNVGTVTKDSMPNLMLYFHNVCREAA